jgi:aryl-alcohol dehydrogenase-like predicted oxidoreductase
LRYRVHRDIPISEIGVGTYALGGAYGPKDIQACERTLHRAVDLGVNFFDTAEAYGSAEEFLGEVLRPHRRDVLIATKVGVRSGFRPNLSADYVARACDESLRRLGTDYIDLYQVHFDDPETPVEETVRALEGLVRAGKIRRYGIGHLPVERVKAYFDAGGIFSVLMELSASARQARRELLPLCHAHDVGALAFSVTGRGLLTGAVGSGTRFGDEDIRSIDPMFQRENLRSGLRVAAKLQDVGGKHGKTPVQVAIAWVLAQPGILCALTGPSNEEHLEENVGGSGWEIPPDDLAALEVLLHQEDETLDQDRRSSIRRILSHSLSEEPSQAFSDLLYVMETAVTLGLVAEKEILPVLQRLLALKKILKEPRSAKALAEIQEVLRGLLRAS